MRGSCAALKDKLRSSILEHAPSRSCLKPVSEVSPGCGEPFLNPIVQIEEPLPKYSASPIQSTRSPLRAAAPAAPEARRAVLSLTEASSLRAKPARIPMKPESFVVAAPSTKRCRPVRRPHRPTASTEYRPQSASGRLRQQASRKLWTRQDRLIRQQHKQSSARRARNAGNVPPARANVLRLRRQESSRFRRPPGCEKNAICPPSGENEGTHVVRRILREPDWL